jgi:hypothetical protein
MHTVFPEPEQRVKEYHEYILDTIKDPKDREELRGILERNIQLKQKVVALPKQGK